MTLEEAQEKIIELTDELADVKTDRDSLLQDNESLKADNENLRTLNQKYFNRLIAQEEPDDTGSEGDEDTIPSCEDLARTLDI